MEHSRRGRDAGMYSQAVGKAGWPVGVRTSGRRVGETKERKRPGADGFQQVGCDVW